MTAYYNEIDKKAAATLRELIRAGVIAPGEVDERDIQDVRPDDLRPFSQCHFFAGIGIWSHAFRLAGWPDERPVWTGSCPCQPFSAAGKGNGFADERHLWPAWFHLIQHGKPEDVPVFGEQVASKDGLSWLDLVQADMEGAGHTCWPFDLCAAGFGAPHIRQRLFFVANASSNRERAGLCDRESAGQRWLVTPDDSGNGRLADMQCPRLEGHAGDGDLGHESGWLRAQPDGSIAQKGITGIMANTNEGGFGVTRDASSHGDTFRVAHSQFDGKDSRGMADADGRNTSPEGIQRSGEQRQFAADGLVGELADSRHKRHERDTRNGWEAERGPEHSSPSDRPGPVNGHWRDADWLLCRDGRWRPVESGTFPLVDGAPARMGRLRCYGNGIVAQVAQAFIEAASEQQLGLAA